MSENNAANAPASPVMTLTKRPAMPWRSGSRFVALSILLCVVAALPFGGAADWARALVAMIAFGTGAYGILARGALGMSNDLPQGLAGRTRAGRNVLLIWLALAGWLVFQLVPLPVGVLSFLEPMSRGTFKALADNGSSAMSLAVDGYDSLFETAYWLAAAVLVLGASRGLSAGDDRIALSWALVAFGCIEALFGLLVRNADWWTGNSFLGKRATGTFSSGNSFGGFLLITVVVNVGMILFYSARRDLRTKQRFWMILALHLALAVQCVGLVMSASRGAMIAVFLAVGLLFGWTFKARTIGTGRSSIRWIAAVLVLALVVGLGGGYGYVYGRFGFGTEDLSAAVVDVSRLAIWKGALLLVVHHPLGVGLGGFGEGILQWITSFGDRRAYFAHSDFLQGLCELGIPGFVLLILGCRLLARSIRKRLKTDADDPLRLLRMGMVAGIAGTLVHALWEFNLSSRPGVLIPFLLLVGMSLAGSRPAPADAQSAIPAPAGTISVPRWSVLAVLIIAAAVVFPVLLRNGAVSVATECGRVAMGASPDEYFWLAVPRVGVGKGNALLDLAARIAPDSPNAQFMRGYRHVMAFDSQARDLVSSNMNEAQDRAVKKGQIEESVRLALRPVEIEAYRTALPSFERAMRLAPRIADMQTTLARAFAELSVAETTGPSGVPWTGRMLSALRCACELAPGDRPTCVRTCRTLAAGVEGLHDPAMLPELQSLMLEYGGRALRHSREHPDDLLVCFVRGGLPLSAVLAITDLPLETIKRIYSTVDNPRSAASALECLDAFRRALERDSGSNRMSATEEKRATSFRRVYVAENAKWLVRTGRWKEYHELADARWWAHGSVMRERLSGIETGGAVSRQVKRLKLRQVRNDFGLDVAHLLDLAKLEFECGDISTARELLAEASIARSPYPVDALAKFIEANPVMSCLPPGFAIAKSRVLMRGGDLDAAVLLLKDSLMNNDDSLRFGGQVYRFMASFYLLKDRPQVARKFAVDGLNVCSTDIDLLRIVTEVEGSEVSVMLPGGLMEPAERVLSFLAPDCKIGTWFLGGAAVLDGLSCRKSGNEGSARIVIRSSWRFLGSVPSDLVAVAWVTEDGKIRPSVSRAIPFRQSAGTQFLAGRPVIGCTTVTELEVPDFMISEAATVSVGLRSESSGRLMPSVEGMQCVQLLGSTVLLLLEQGAKDESVTPPPAIFQSP